MKLQISSKWGGIYVPARVRQFTKVAKLCGKKNFREYAGILTADSERAAVSEWLDSKAPLHLARTAG